MTPSEIKFRLTTTWVLMAFPMTSSSTVMVSCILTSQWTQVIRMGVSRRYPGVSHLGWTCVIWQPESIIRSLALFPFMVPWVHSRSCWRAWAIKQTSVGHCLVISPYLLHWKQHGPFIASKAGGLGGLSVWVVVGIVAAGIVLSGGFA